MVVWCCCEWGLVVLCGLCVLFFSEVLMRLIEWGKWEGGVKMFCLEWGFF